MTERSHQLPCRLDAVRPGDCVLIVGLDAAVGPATGAAEAREAEVDDDLTRLRALGLCEGRHVRVLRAADPMIVRVFDTRLGVSRDLARRVRATPCDAGHGRLEGLA